MVSGGISFRAERWWRSMALPTRARRSRELGARTQETPKSREWLRALVSRQLLGRERQRAAAFLLGREVADAREIGDEILVRLALGVFRRNPQQIRRVHRHVA